MAKITPGTGEGAIASLPKETYLFWTRDFPFRTEGFLLSEAILTGIQ